MLPVQRNEYTIEGAINSVSRVLNAAKNSNQAGEDLIVVMAHAGDLYEALAKISDACPHIEPHAREQEYDFGSQYFNTPDDYARYCVAKNLSDLGDKARAAIARIEGEGK